MENELNEAVEWRWVDDKGRAMTNWKAGNQHDLRETTMELDCYMGQKHAWMPTGNGFRLWQDNTTSMEHAPKDAPYYAEEKCWRCGAVRHVAHMPPNTRI